MLRIIHTFSTRPFRIVGNNLRLRTTIPTHPGPSFPYLAALLHMQTPISALYYIGRSLSSSLDGKAQIALYNIGGGPDPHLGMGLDHRFSGLFSDMEPTGMLLMLLVLLLPSLVDMPLSLLADMGVYLLLLVLGKRTCFCLYWCICLSIWPEAVGSGTSYATT